ncbi:Hpt domain-containing protein [Achromobacter denitrificans]
MNLALLVGRPPESLRELSAHLKGLGFAIDTCTNAAVLSGRQASPRLVLWVEDMSDAPLNPLPAAVVDAPIRLLVSASTARSAEVDAIVAPPASEADLLDALLEAGYGLPDDGECAGIRQTLHDLVDGDPAIVAELIDSLLDTAQADLAGYQARCAVQGWGAAGSLAHRIKGTARMAGCISLTRLCERIEEASRAEDGDAIRRLNTLFEPALQRLCAELGNLRQAH